jgi:hypothetical protein
MLDQKWRFKVVLSGVFLFFLSARSAAAYIDPGTGSYLFQLLAAGLLSSLFFMKTIIRSVKKVFKNIFFSKEEENNIIENDRNK